MNGATQPTIDIKDLRKGLFIHLDLGWMEHPFPLGSFKVTTEQQIETLKSLGVRRVRYSPDKSDPPDASDPASAPAGAPAAAGNGAANPEPISRIAALRQQVEAAREERKNRLREQQQSLMQCERQFAQATRAYRQMADEVDSAPEAARERGMQVVDTVVQQMQSDGESAIRLLSESLGDRASLHSVNVTVLCLLLGRAMGMATPQLAELGAAALMHDLGKGQLPDRVRFRDDQFSTAQFKLYQEHVAHSVAIGKRMGLSAPVLLAISQHHEMADGSGFPQGVGQDRISPAARIIALVNRYDNLCNPGSPSGALTPHEALSLMFAQMKGRFDGATLSAFIRMMGVYPPGSVVQMTDGRYALVVSVNSARPLKPRVIVHDVGVPKDEALVLDLEDAPEMAIRRGVNPLTLPRPTLDYLSPRTRICYYFEQAAAPETAPAA